MWCRTICILHDIWTWYPGVGWFISILGAMGVAVAILRDFTKISQKEKAIWLAVTFLLLMLELRSIKLDRDTHEKEQREARAEQLKEFDRIAGGIDKTITNSQSEFQATMKRSDQIVSGVAEGIKTVTGGDSFSIVELSSDRTSLILYNPGDYPLTSFQARLSDETLGHEFNFVSRYPLIPHASGVFGYQLGAGDREDFLIEFTAVNGGWWETLQLRKVNGIWQQALKVERPPKVVRLDGTPKIKIIKQEVDPLYPGASEKNVQWCKFVFFRPLSEPNPCIPNSQKK